MRCVFKPIGLFGSLYSSRNMSVFTKRTNPLTGKAEWELQDETYDFHQEIARSAFADMLHDTERNKMYFTAIRRAVEKLKRRGSKAHVLDIGAGTGLLSMMAATCGADSVVACEAFPPMAECAEKIINKNNLQDRIKIVPKRSTDLTVGETGDMKHRANVLVTEIFDTELIGEGALGVFSHAHQNLLETDCIVVPMAGTLYYQVVESKLAQRWNKMEPICISSKTPPLVLDTPSTVWNCAGAAGVHDIQLSQFPQSEFKTIISPRPIITFDWSGRSTLPYNLSTVSVSKAECDGVAQVVFVWWDLDMDSDGEIILSCAPVWAHPLAKKEVNADSLPWRDHWMQAVYYLPKEVEVKKNEELTVICTHDEFSFWFNMRKGHRLSEDDYMRPLCNCGLHTGFSRTRIGAMNDTERMNKYISALQPYVNSESICLCLSEGTLLGLVVAKLGAKKVYCIEGNNLARRVLEDYINCNNLDGTVELLDNIDCTSKRMDLEKKVTLVMGEPNFFTTLLPWHNVYFWYMKQELTHLLSESVYILPLEAAVWAVAVEFKDLYKIRAPLCSVEGFTVAELDDLIQHSSSISDSTVEAHPLWEYPCRALTKPFQILDFSFINNIADCSVQKEGTLEFGGSGICHGIALWVEWDLDGNPKHTISTGPVELVTVGEHIKWDMYTRQGVYFIPNHHSVGEMLAVLNFSVKFLPNSEGLNFQFNISPKV